MGDTAAVAHLCDALWDVDVTVRLAAVNALRQIADTRAADRLCAAFKDSDQQVRSAAARAIVEIKSLRAVEPLCELLKNQDRSIRASAMDALEQIGDVYILPFRVLIDGDLNPAERLDALQALATVRSRSGGNIMRVGSIPTFCEGICALSDADPDLQVGAAAVLNEIRNRSRIGSTHAGK